MILSIWDTFLCNYYVRYVSKWYLPNMHDLFSTVFVLYILSILPFILPNFVFLTMFLWLFNLCFMLYMLCYTYKHSDHVDHRVSKRAATLDMMLSCSNRNPTCMICTLAFLVLFHTNRTLGTVLLCKTGLCKSGSMYRLACYLMTVQC